MSVVDTKGTRIVKIPRWESELWSYVHRSDGEHCPLYDYCRQRLRTGFCPYENMSHIRKLMDAEEINARNYNFLTNATPDRMLKLAAKLAGSYLKKGKVRLPPVPNELISLADETQFIEVRLVPLKAYHGAVWHLKDGWVIHLNKNDPPAVRRLTLFHEAFHIIAHDKYRIRLRGRANRGTFYEFLAECFSASILMPRVWVSQRWAVVNDLDKMSEIFDVPKPAMYIELRLQNLI